jgi:sugar-specific transcriptional regulator TrmB
MLKKQDEIREEYEEQIRTEKEERERDEQEKIRKQNIQQKFMNGTVAIATKIREQNRQIDDYVRLFSTNHGRKPLKDEINTSLNAKLDNDILNKYLDRYDTDYVDVEIQEDDSMV